MKLITNNLRLTNQKVFEEQFKQYSYIIESDKKSKKKIIYNSLADMKHQLFSEISAYSVEELDFLREFIKAKSTRADKITSGFLPIWAAVAIALCSTIWNNSIVSLTSLVFLIVILVFSGILSDEGVRRLTYCAMILELIEKIEETRGHTFNDTLAEENEIKK